MFNTPFIVPVVAMLIPIIAIVMKNWRQVQNRKMDLMERGTAEISAQSQARIEKLEARIAVLERIATDRQLGLAAEIDRLGSDLRPTSPRQLDN